MITQRPAEEADDAAIGDCQLVQWSYPGTR